MNELRGLLKQLDEWKEQGERVAMATVVAINGSAYRRPGARLLIAENGQSAGMIGGGCFDQDVIEVALQVIQTGKPRLHLYHLSDTSVWGLGLGCNGSVFILIESLETAEGREWRNEVTQALTTKRALTISHAFSKELTFSRPFINEEVAFARSYHAGEAKPTPGGFCEKINPDARLVIFGAGQDAVPVVDLAGQCGFEVVVVDHRESALTKERFPKAAELILARSEDYRQKIVAEKNDYVLFMTHRIDHDALAFDFYRSCAPGYLGFLGPKRRMEQIAGEILGLDKTEMERLSPYIHAPVGLDLGAETPEQVALSILSEIMIRKNNRQLQFLKDKAGPIHAAEQLSLQTTK
ncbi:XdhC family protein [Alkalihalobacillus oceani]|uniref:XdhC family protein n=1 Tax=Halalkalibacter oceani TaxID=1653776 RepID=A0A9X2DMY6_9BACI|nr:XdhC family protein [Halalkalibacter oceani]MCM3713816.1 XdhC family protein [Halalkalibacter oceani]